MWKIRFCQIGSGFFECFRSLNGPKNGGKPRKSVRGIRPATAAESVFSEKLLPACLWKTETGKTAVENLENRTRKENHCGGKLRVSTDPFKREFHTVFS